MNWISHRHMCPWQGFSFFPTPVTTGPFFGENVMAQSWWLADKDNPIPHQWQWSTAIKLISVSSQMNLVIYYIYIYIIGMYSIISLLQFFTIILLISPFHSPCHLCIGFPVVPKTDNFGQHGMARVAWSWSTSLWIPVPKPRWNFRQGKRELLQFFF